MVACTFFGHRDTPKSIISVLHTILIDLIENTDVDTFYVGNHGNFDRMVYQVLQELKQHYPYIRITVVLAYMPTETSFNNEINTILPENIETIPKRFAIDYRNNWMLRQSHYVITYITYSWGGAAKYATLAKKRKKVIINIADILS